MRQHERMRYGLLVLLLALIAPLYAQDVPTPTATVTPQPLPPGMTEAYEVMGDICFEAADDDAGQVFIVRDALELIRLYDQINDAQLCRQPIERANFDFSAGRVLVGIWSKGAGCTAHHNILNFQRDTHDQVITLELRLVAQGDCPYELLRPFWVGIEDAFDSEIQVTIIE